MGFSSFEIDVSTVRDIRDGTIDPHDLVLSKKATANGHVWEVKKMTDAGVQPGEVQAKGNELVDILKKVANGEKLSDNLKELGENRKFRVFSKQVPGMETLSHKQRVQESIKAKASRLRETLRYLGKGTSSLTAAGKPWRMVDVDKHYILAEVLIKGAGVSADVARKLANCWKNSETTHDFRSWIQSQKEQWQASGSSEEFASLVMLNSWNDREINQYKSEHPGEDISREKFEAWKQIQYPKDSLLAEPLWLLQKDWKEDNENLIKDNKPVESFDEWSKNTINGRREYWQRQPQESQGLFNYGQVDDDLFKKLDQKVFQYHNQSGSSLDSLIWIARELWLETSPPDRSDEAFINHIESQMCAFTLKEQKQLSQLPTPTAEELEAWKGNKEKQMQEQWKASRNLLPYAEWKSQQILDPLRPVPFVTLSARQRLGYRTECENGKLQRSGKAYGTVLEKTEHSGKGWVIFVISPQNELYCASHLLGIFHHSSFLGGRAVRAGGEIKTDDQGKITHISGKSGHYKPSHVENREMLRWFADRGTDLSNVSFTCFLPGGVESEPINALDYLNGAIPQPKSK